MSDRLTGQSVLQLRVVLVVLFVAGWATNHFAALIPVLRETEHLSATVLAGAFGVYALGLLPGLLGGGALSDRIGRRSVVLTGSLVAAAGNLLMLAWHPAAGVYTGRLVVGVGVGLAISGGTAWAADLGGARGTTIAGVTLTAGFACGPLVAGIVAEVVPAGAAVAAPFAVAIVLSVAAVLLALARTTSAAPPAHGPSRTAAPTEAGVERSVGRALVRSVPMALWVFSAVTVPVVVLAGRLGGDLSGPMVPGLASALALGTGVAVQVAARRAGWGPRSGIAGALLAAVGFGISARTDTDPGVALFVVASVLLGSAYGLCLRAGLVDVEAFTPPEHRGVTVGIYYVCTYLGFGLPVLLEALRPGVGTTTPLLVLTALALAAGVLRGVQLHAAGARLR